MSVTLQRKFVRKQIQCVRNTQIKIGMLEWFNQQKDTQEFTCSLFLDKIVLVGKVSNYETYQENLKMFVYKHNERKFENYKRALKLLDLNINDDQVLHFVGKLHENL